jgi:hypothetical protein
MYRHNENQLKFVEFELPFGGNLLASKRWVRMAHMIPWGEFEEAYCANLSKSGTGPPAFSVRMALAALIIKERLGVSDDECVEQIQENHYSQGLRWRIYTSGLHSLYMGKRMISIVSLKTI